MIKSPTQESGRSRLSVFSILGVVFLCGAVANSLTRTAPVEEAADGDAAVAG